MFVLRPMLSLMTTPPRDVDRTFTPEVRAAVEANPDRVLTDEELSAVAGFPIRTHFYFAYGSNLLDSVFRGRRGIDPLQTLPCTMRGYALAFNLPALPVLEPAMANIRRCAHAGAGAGEGHASSCDGCVVHGVAYRITADQMRHLHSTELSYDLVTCSAVTYGLGHHAIAVQVLVVKPQVLLLEPHEEEHARPSLRYLDILRRGAEEKRLHPDWVARLHAHPAAPPTHALVKVAVALLLAGPALVLVALDTFSRLWATPAQRADARHRVTATVMRFMWAAYRAVAMPQPMREGSRAAVAPVGESGEAQRVGKRRS